MAKAAALRPMPAPADAALRQIVPPEGVPIPVRLADRGTRAIALVIDLIIIIAIIVAVGLAAAYGAANLSLAAWGLALVILVSFLVRSFYFILFELRWQGTTPGKRALGLRVIDRGGGRLRPEAVFARNLMREVEVFTPISVLLMGERIGAGGWTALFTLVWLGIFVLMPFFNRDRMRVGDLVGGTWVIAMPKAVLSPDMAGPAPAESMAGRAREGYAFTPAQLDIYGVYELQTLEQVLRDSGPHAAAMRDEVSGRIRRKIGWSGPEVTDSTAFLQAFYAALRGRLETGMLFGRRRRDQHDRP